MKKLKVLFLSEAYYPIYGGVTSVVDNVAKAISKYCDVTVGAVKSEDPDFVEPNKDYKIIRCDGFYNKTLINMTPQIKSKSDFCKYIEKENFDIIHCHFPLDFFAWAKKFGKKHNIPVVVTAHGIYYDDFLKFIKIPLFAKIGVAYIIAQFNTAYKIFAVSKFCKNTLLKYGLRKDTIVMPNATYIIDNDTHLVDIDKIYNLQKDNFVILSVGRLVELKNDKLTIKAIKELNNPQIKYLIVGSGDYENNLKKLVKKLNLENQVFFVGAIKDRDILCEYYKRADVVSFPSTFDSSGLIQFEASYFSKATIAVKDTAVSENFIDMHNGIVIDNTVESYVEKLKYIFEHRDILKTIGINARNEICRTYNDEKIVDEIINTYKFIVEDFKQKINLKNNKIKKINN